MTDNGVMKGRKPQLADSIERLDAMVDGLAVAIPGAVGEAVRAALGPMLATVIKDAVEVAVKQAMAEAAVKPVPTPTPVVAETPKPAAPSKPGIWARVKAGMRQLKAWAAKKASPVAARVAFGWAVMKIIGGATVRNKPAAVATALTGTLAGFIGFAAGEVGSAVMLGLSAGVMTACAMWAGPMVGLLTMGLREE